jgi:hypothetical protein
VGRIIRSPSPAETATKPAGVKTVSDKSASGMDCDGVCFERAWEMPNSATFEIDAIRELVTTEINRSEGLWVDPFAGESDLADVTNDLNPETDTDRTMDAVEFLQEFDAQEIDGGVLFDPPYSPRQIKEVYDDVGIETTQETTQARFWSDVKAEIERVCRSGATVVTCGWNSGGVGKTAGFNLRRILLVAHGGWHNDTIVTVEDRVRSELSEYQGGLVTAEGGRNTRYEDTETDRSDGGRVGDEPGGGES